MLFGLPRLLTGSILAHELMHAYLRTNGYRDLAPPVRVQWTLPLLLACSAGWQRQLRATPASVVLTYFLLGLATALTPKVEEGLCQLAALLYLEGCQAAGYKNAYEERLAAFLGHQLRSVPPAAKSAGGYHAHWQGIG